MLDRAGSGASQTSLGWAELHDDRLVDALRAGQDAAFTELYRRHGPAALGVARRVLGAGPSADDAVAEAFTALLTQAREGGGPTSNVRSYLLTSVRNAALSHVRSQERVRPSSHEALDGPAYDPDRLTVAEDVSLVRSAFGTLPARWQQVLWYLDVEGMTPAQAAPMLGISPNAASSLARRARDRLRHGYLQAHVRRADPGCADFSPHLARYAQGGLTPQVRRRIETHLTTCAPCTAVVEELSDLRGRMRILLLPLGAPAVLAASSDGQRSHRAGRSALGGRWAARRRTRGAAAGALAVVGASGTMASARPTDDGSDGPADDLATGMVGSPPEGVVGGVAGVHEADDLDRATAAVPLGGERAGAAAGAAAAVVAAAAAGAERGPSALSRRGRRRGVGGAAGASAVRQRDGASSGGLLLLPIVGWFGEWPRWWSAVVGTVRHPGRFVRRVWWSRPARTWPWSVGVVSTVLVVLLGVAASGMLPVPVVLAPVGAPVASDEADPEDAESGVEGDEGDPSVPAEAQGSGAVPTPEEHGSPVGAPDGAGGEGPGTGDDSGAPGDAAPPGVPRGAADPGDPTTPPDPVELDAVFEDLGDLAPGRPGVLGVTVTHAGPALVATVVLEVVLPAGVALDSADLGRASSDWTCKASGAGALCTVRGLALGAASTLLVPVVVAPHTTQGAVPVTVRPADGQSDAVFSQDVMVRDSPLAARYVAVGDVGVTQVGAPVLHCPPSDSRCASVVDGTATGTLQDNKAWQMVTVDELGTGTPSSRARLDLPSGSEIVSARLYWGGEYRTGMCDGSVGTVRLASPGGSLRQPVGEVVVERAPGRDYAVYQASVDVTAQVRAGGSGTWGVADVCTAGGSGSMAGWALVVVHRDPTGTASRLAIVNDGLMAVTKGDGGRETVVAGRAGSQARIGAVAWEGDRATGGDQLFLDGTALVPLRWTGSGPGAVGSGSNAFDSTAWGSSYANSLGVDVKPFRPTALLASRAELRAVSTGDDFWVGALTVVTGGS